MDVPPSIDELDERLDALDNERPAPAAPDDIEARHRAEAGAMLDNLDDTFALLRAERAAGKHPPIREYRDEAWELYQATRGGHA